MTPSISSVKGSSIKSTSVIVTAPDVETVPSTLTVLVPEAARQLALGLPPQTVLLEASAV